MIQVGRRTQSASLRQRFWSALELSSLGIKTLAVMAILCVIGLFFVFESSTAESFAMVGNQYHFLRQQSLWMLLGMVTLLIGRFLPTEFWRKTAVLWYGIGFLFLIAVFLPGIGVQLNGAHRWINLGFTLFQPAEFYKFAVIIFFASWMIKHQRLGAFLIFVGLPALLIILQPDLGSLLVVLWISFGMYFLAYGSIRKLLPFFGLGILLMIIAIIISPYRLQRLTTYLNPEKDPYGAGFHVRQVTIALGSGGMMGKGIGNSHQKYLYIPEASSDSIFAVVAEEVGFVGSVFLISLFGYFIYLLYLLTGMTKPNSFERLVGYGIMLWISGQIVLNLAAVVALVPLTGIPLPFFSYGGSSLLMLFFIIGVLLQISHTSGDRHTRTVREYTQL